MAKSLLAPAYIPAHEITGVVLAGGQASRMGGVDKGLQMLSGQCLAAHVLERLAPQVGALCISANRNVDAYRALLAPYDGAVITDALAGYAGPLAGFLSALQHCHTPWLLTVPCDSPRLPMDLAQRLAAGCLGSGAPLALACTPERDPSGQTHWHRQPVFCLMQRSLLSNLELFTQAGHRKIAFWASKAGAVDVRFDQAHDDPWAFYNANTADELRALEGHIGHTHEGRS